MSGIRRNKPAGRFGRHGVRLPTRLAPITKPSKALSAVWDAGTPSLELIGKSTPEGDILTPTVSQDQFEGSCKDLLLDLGNGPAQAIIDQNARTLAQRVADETREELARVLERVELIYGQFELSESLALKNAENNLEYVNDMAELEELINDQVKKKKYQKQVTVFIVGFDNMCSQRLRLLQQVSEFFTENVRWLDEEEAAVSTDDIDLEEVAGAVEDSLHTAGQLTHRLSEINKEMVNYMVSLTQSKTTNKSKKKLERALEKAREESNTLNGQLATLQKELVEKEQKIQVMFRQIETKTMEIQRYKTAAEVAKTSAAEVDTLRDYCLSRDEQIRQLTKELDAVKTDQGQAQKSQDEVLQALQQTKDINQEKVEQLQKALDQKDTEKETATEELRELHREQLSELEVTHKEQVEQMKTKHAEKVQQLLAYAEPSRPSTKESATSAKERQSGKVQVLRKVKDSRSASEPDTRRPSVCSRNKSRSNLEPVHEAEQVTDFDNEFDLDDEAAWAGVPPSHVFGRFAQYRKLVQEKMGAMDNELRTAISKTVRKVRTLKAQFQEHKHKWQTEREILLQQVEQAYKLQGEAEKDADTALSHLEGFINEQEQLEAEEEKVLNAMEEAQKADDLEKTDQMDEIVEESESEVLLSQTDDAKAEVLYQSTGSATEDMEDKEPRCQSTSMTDHSLLRDQHRQEIENLRTSAEERRKKSPSFLSLRSQVSVLTDAQLDEDGDIPFSPETIGDADRETSFHDVGTSPMSGVQDLPSARQSRASFGLAAHPVVQEYLDTYSAVTDFKLQISELFANKEMMSPAQVLAEIETFEFNEEDRVQPQIEVMNISIAKILSQSLTLISAALASERDYPVSSLAGNSKLMSVSTMETTEHADTATSPLTKQSQSSTAEHVQQLQQLQQHHDSLQKQFVEAKQNYEVQLNHNTVMMMEMQDTISKLQHDLLEAAQKRAADGTPDSQQAESAIMFTRLDSERNAKMMKRAVNEHKLEYDKYKKAVSTMDTYVSLPAQRLAYLVRKYVHHRRMRMVEDNVRQHRADLNDAVYTTLGKMETLQNERARKWEEKMDELGDQRQQLANMLMQTLNNIEEESGIFLVKPMFAYKSLYNPKKFYGKPYEQYWSTRGAGETPQGQTAHGQRGYAEGLRREGAALDTLQSTYMPPTPASGKQEAALSQAEDEFYSRRLITGNPQEGIAGRGSHLIGNYPQPSWNPDQSQSKALSFNTLTQNYLNTPKMLELDINRMLIAQNQISTRMPTQGATGEQIGTAGMRSYVSVKRHVGQPGMSERHTTPGVTTVRRSDLMSKSTSLPPIAPMLTKEADVTFPLPPSSPPGSTPCLSATPFPAD